jgi:alpha-L-rhamnosidase
MITTDSRYTVKRKTLEQTEVPPVETRLTGDETLFLDFGKAAFGTLLLPFSSGQRQGTMVIHLGEKLSANGRIDRNPPGSVRYIRIEQEIDESQQSTRIIVPPDERNTGPAAIKMPPEIGEVYPFRYAEIEGASAVDSSAVRQISVHYPFNDDASLFSSSDAVLNSVWDLCKYSIKATTFCGVYVDGDRERIPYRSKLVEHDPARIYRHARGLGYEVQEQPGLESCLGGCPRQHHPALCAGRPPN